MRRGDWVRIFAESDDAAGAGEGASTVGRPKSKPAKALENAVVLGESKGDVAQAMRILDANLSQDAPV